MNAEEVATAFGAAIGDGDLDAARSFLARHGALVTPDATTVRGRVDAMAVIAQLVASGPEVVIESSHLLEAEDVALVRQCWRIVVSPDFQRPLSRRFETTLLLRRIEGVWKLAVVAPWGLDGAGGRRVQGTLTFAAVGE